MTLFTPFPATSSRHGKPDGHPTSSLARQATDTGHGAPWAQVDILREIESVERLDRYRDLWLPVNKPQMESDELIDVSFAQKGMKRLCNLTQFLAVMFVLAFALSLIFNGITGV